MTINPALEEKIRTQQEQLKDKRILTLSGRIFEQITVSMLYTKLHVIAQEIDIQSFDVIAFDKDNKLGGLFSFENDKPALISIKARGAQPPLTVATMINGVSLEKARLALAYGEKLGISKLLYGVCFFNFENMGEFEIYLIPIKDALEEAERTNGGSIRFRTLIKVLKETPKKCYQLWPVRNENQKLDSTVN